MRVQTLAIVGMLATTIISACVGDYDESCGTNSSDCPDGTTGLATCSWRNKKKSNQILTSGVGYNSAKAKDSDCIEDCYRNVGGVHVDCLSRTNTVHGSIPDTNSGSCTAGTGTH